MRKRVRGFASKREYKEALRRLPQPVGAVSPTLPERINRLNPSERHDLQSLIRSMKLRKIVRRTLAEAFWAREEAQPALDSMQRLRQTVREHASSMSYERALTSFEPPALSVDFATADSAEDVQ